MLQTIKTVIKKLLKRIALYSTLSLLLLGLLMMTPFWSKMLLFGLNKLPVNVVTENSLQKIQPKFIVVLGGGLNRNANNDIQPNTYSRYRLKTAIKLHEQTALPFLLSGVESPWMKDWLEKNKINDYQILTEEKSLNTCENANFTFEKLRNAGVNHVYLITDAYHMVRARRQFARHGVFTSPTVAPVGRLSRLAWDTPFNNLNHSRRATYEIIANIRDSALTQTNCRKTPPYTTHSENNPQPPKMADSLF